MISVSLKKFAWEKIPGRSLFQRQSDLQIGIAELPFY